MTREEAVKVIDGRFEIMDYCENEKLEEALDIAIKALEQSERKKGKWIDSRDVSWMCSECGKWLDVLQGDVDMNFCPNCGAKMEVNRND